MTVLKALKKIFGKAEGEQSSPATPTPVTPSAPRVQHDARTEKTSRSATPNPTAAAEKPLPSKDKPVKARRERPAKPLDTWKLEDFAVEPAEGKTRFHDFKLAPELMHAIHDLGFPYCTPIQA